MILNIFKSISNIQIYTNTYKYTKIFESNVSDSNDSGFGNKIKLVNTENLVIGMAITGDNVKGYTTITSVDTDTDMMMKYEGWCQERNFNSRPAPHGARTDSRSPGVSFTQSGVGIASWVVPSSTTDPLNLQLYRDDDICVCQGCVAVEVGRGGQ